MQNVRAGSRITADLTDLPFDADLVLYGPAGLSTAPSVFPNAQGLPGRFVEDPGLGVGRAATAVAAEALTDLQLDRGYHDPFFDRPAATALPGADAALHLPAPRHRPGERGRDRPGRRQLHHRDLGLQRRPSATTRTCAGQGLRADAGGLLHRPARSPTRPPRRTRSRDRARRQHGVPHEPEPPGGDLRRDRCERRRDQAQRPRHLPRCTPRAGLKAAVVPVDAYPGVDGLYGTWDANPCSVSAANGVAAAITACSRRSRPRPPGVSYVTLVGGDDILPMGRVPDLTRIAQRVRLCDRPSATRRTRSRPRRPRATPSPTTPTATRTPRSIGDGNSPVRAAARRRPPRGVTRRDQGAPPGLHRRRRRQARHGDRPRRRLRLPRRRRACRRQPARRPAGRTSTAR